MAVVVVETRFVPEMPGPLTRYPAAYCTGCHDSVTVVPDAVPVRPVGLVGGGALKSAATSPKWLSC